MGRAVCEGCMSIDVRSWHREGLLRIGQPFAHALTWGGEPQRHGRTRESRRRRAGVPIAEVGRRVRPIHNAARPDRVDAVHPWREPSLVPL